MTMLDENLRRLLRECTPPRLSEDDLDRALARFEGRRRPAPAHGRLLAALAALLLIGALAFWLVPSSPPQVPAQAAPEDLERLIRELGAPETREKAKARLLEIGPSALKALERALYHDDPEVRVQSQEVAKALRRVADIQAPLAFVRAAVKIARARWTARDFTDFDAVLLEAFEPETPSVHYVPRKTIGENFDAALPHPVPLIGGRALARRRDELTPAVVAALEKNDGLAFVHATGEVTDLSVFLLFTLPDKVGWSAYVVACLPELTGDEAMRVSAAFGEDDMVLFLRRTSFTPRPGGGLEIAGLDPGHSASKVFKKGDVLRALDGKPVTDVKDLAPLAQVSRHAFTVDRQGKVFALEVAVVVHPVIKLTPKGATEAQQLLQAADAAWADNSDKALELYTEVLNRYSASDLLTKERRVQILDRVATLMERKSKGK